MSRPTLRERLADQTSHRFRSLLQTPVAAEKDFGSVDALGLSRHFQVLGALEDCCAREGVQCGPLRSQHLDLENLFCSWLGFEAARSFQNLGQARLALQLAILSDENDLALHDHLNATALTDASHLAGCRIRRYPHGDAAGAAWQMRQSPRALTALISEGIFQSDGQLAPLAALADAATAHQACLLIDDALGVGSCGDDGRGSMALAHLAPSHVDGLIVSLEHALGLQGAVVLGSAALLSRIDDVALHRDLPRPSTAIASAAQVSVQLARRDTWRRDRLQELGQKLHQQLSANGLVNDSQPPAALHVVEVEGQTKHWGEAILRHGIRVPATALVRADGAQVTRLHIHLSAIHDVNHVSLLADALAMCRDTIATQASCVPLEA